MAKEKKLKIKIGEHKDSQKSFFPGKNASKKELREFIKSVISWSDRAPCPTCGRLPILKKAKKKRKGMAGIAIAVASLDNIKISPRHKGPKKRMTTLLDLDGEIDVF